MKELCDCSSGCAHGIYWEQKPGERPGPIFPMKFRCGKGHRPRVVELPRTTSWGGGKSGYARRGCEDFQVEEVGG